MTSILAAALVVASSCSVASTEQASMLFPSVPLASEFAMGAKVARQRPAPQPLKWLGGAAPQRDPWAVLDAARVPIGWWSNGWSKRPIEHATCLSPTLMSRWLGFLAERDGLGASETQNRWHELGQGLSGQIVVMVELGAFPKTTTMDLGDAVPADSGEIDEARYRFEFADGSLHDACVTILADRVGKGIRDVERLPWWRWSRLSPSLSGAFDEDPPEPPTFGDYRRRWLLVSTNALPDPGEGFALIIQSPRKSRVARFGPDGMPLDRKSSQSTD